MGWFCCYFLYFSIPFLCKCTHAQSTFQKRSFKLCVVISHVFWMGYLVCELTRSQKKTPKTLFFDTSFPLLKTACVCLINKCPALNMFLLYLGFLRYSEADHMLNCLKLGVLHWKIRKVKTQYVKVHSSGLTLARTEIPKLRAWLPKTPCWSKSSFCPPPLIMSGGWTPKCRYFISKCLNLSEIYLFLLIHRPSQSNPFVLTNIFCKVALATFSHLTGCTLQVSSVHPFSISISLYNLF